MLQSVETLGLKFYHVVIALHMEDAVRTSTQTLRNSNRIFLLGDLRRSRHLAEPAGQADRQQLREATEEVSTEPRRPVEGTLPTTERGGDDKNWLHQITTTLRIFSGGSQSDDSEASEDSDGYRHSIDSETTPLEAAHKRQTAMSDPELPVEYLRAMPDPKWSDDVINIPNGRSPC